MIKIIELVNYSYIYYQKGSKEDKYNFLSENSILKSIDNENIIKIHDYF